MKTLLVATYDSFLQSGVNFLRDLGISDFDITIPYLCRNQISERQVVTILGDRSFEVIVLGKLWAQSIENYEAVIVSAGIKDSKQIFTLVKKYASGAVTVGLQAGILFGDVDSLCAKNLADINVVNTEYDKRVNEKIQEAIQWERRSLTLVHGYRKYSDLKPLSKRLRLCYFDQLIVPRTLTERRYVVGRLVEYANKYPDRDVVLKLRAKGEERTPHQQTHSVELILKEFNLPSNLHVSCEPLARVLSKIDIALSFSSTALVEAIGSGVRSFPISDLGVKNELLNSGFLDSNLFRSFDELLDDQIAFEPNPLWLESFCSPLLSLDSYCQALESKRINKRAAAYSSAPLHSDVTSTGGPISRKFRKMIRNPAGFFLHSRYRFVSKLYFLFFGAWVKGDYLVSRVARKNKEYVS